MMSPHTARSPERAEDKRRPDRGEFQQLPDPVAENLERRLTDAGLEHDDGEQQLQPETPGHGSQVDGAAIGRPSDRDRRNEGQPDQWLEAFHSASSSPSVGYVM